MLLSQSSCILHVLFSLELFMDHESVLVLILVFSPIGLEVRILAGLTGSQRLGFQLDDQILSLLEQVL
jgi:hypothetical protein